MIRLYYNPQNVGDVIMIRLVAESRPVTRTVNLDSLTVIYSDSEVVAYNLFAPKIEIKERGIIYNPSIELLEYINRRLQEHQFPPLGELAKPNFQVGHILECESIKDTHLHLCKVDVKDEVLQIVCGASNVYQGQRVVVARVGCLMPDGTIISVGTLKGYQSFGMLCSKRELGLADDGVKGLYLLDDSFEIGTKIKSAI